MNRLHLMLAASLVATAAAHADTVINLNATQPGTAASDFAPSNTLAPAFYYTTTLAAGSYSLSIVGPTTNGAVYSAWNPREANGQPAPANWEETFNVNTNGDSFSVVNGVNTYNVADEHTDAQFFTTGTFNCQAGCYDSAAAALASVAGETETLTLASATKVTFYIPDDPNGIFPGYTDNSGGVSIDIHAVTPEPSSLVLLGTGALGLAGAVRRKYFAS